MSFDFSKLKAISNERSSNEDRRNSSDPFVSFITGGADASMSIDLANINPLRWATNAVRNFVANSLDKDQGIWIGKRGVSASPIYLTLSPGFDLSHWAVRIRGINYHLKLTDNSKSFLIELDKEDKLTNRFNWKMYEDSNSVIIKSDHEIENYINKNLNKGKYHAVVQDNCLNCQTAIFNLIEYSTGQNFAAISAQYLFLIGSVLF